MLARRHIPNLLTFARVAAVPLCLTIMLLNPACKAVALLWIFVAASLTDFLDGYLARRWNVISPLGALLDPIADKLLVALMLIYLLTAIGAGIFLPVIVILLRELYISGLREFLAARQIKLPVSKGGKWKTALQMVAIISALFANAYNATATMTLKECGNAEALTTCESLPIINEIAAFAATPLLYLAAALAITSAISYTRASWKHLRDTK